MSRSLLRGAEHSFARSRRPRVLARLADHQLCVLPRHAHKGPAEEGTARRKARVAASVAGGRRCVRPARAGRPGLGRVSDARRRHRCARCGLRSSAGRLQQVARAPRPHSKPDWWTSLRSAGPTSATQTWRSGSSTVGFLTEADRSTYYTGFTDFCCPFTQRCIHGSLRPGACTIERRLSYIRAPDMRSLGLGRRAAAYRHVDTNEAIV